MGFGDTRTSTLGRAYDSTIGSHPAIEAATISAAGAVLGDFAGNYGTRLALKMLPIQSLMGRPITQEEYDDTIASMRNLGRWGGALAGPAISVAKNMDRNNGVEGAVQSMWDSEYWKKNPHARAARIAALEARKSTPYAHKSFSSGRINKHASFTGDLRSMAGSFEDPMQSDDVPISVSMDLLNQDPFLTTSQKKFSKELVESSDEGAGMTSGQKIMRSAVRAGVGFGASYLFGRAASTIFSLPAPLAEGLSRVGGVAGAIINTGVFENDR